jgi:hypothetical protein
MSVVRDSVIALLIGVSQPFYLTDSSRLMSMPIVVTTSSLFRIKLDQGINTHNGDTGLHCGLQLLHLTHTWFKDTSLQAIVYLAVRQIQAIVLVVLGFRQLLGVL